MTCRMVSLIVLLLAAATPGETIELVGERWTISVNPATLATDARTPAGDTLPISAPARPATTRVARLEQNAQRATWTLPDDRVAVETRLEADALIIAFRAQTPGDFAWPLLPPSANPRAYVLPMFEGLYIPADDPEWGQFLVDQGGMNTTAGLSMPFWGVDHGPQSLTYLLTNPFNNTLTFQQSNARTGLQLTHAFTTNQDVKEFGYRIHLTDNSPVAPARIYRAHLIDTGQFVSMKQKIARTPDAANLAGAAHIYLWGDGVIAPDDVTDYKAFAARLVAAGRAEEPSPARRVWSLLSEDARALLADLPAKEWIDRHAKGTICDDLARVLKRRDFHTPDDWRGTALPDEARALLQLDQPSAAQVARRNALLLHAAFGDVLKPIDAWGDGFSTPMIDALAAAGLDRLWLGSPDWDGLTHRPDAVRNAIAKGYLVGPYDSYHSIHAPRETDTWETAQFDQALYDTGGIVNADGTTRRGFKQKGRLLSPRAARPHVERRVAELMAKFRCNSWFVDCDAFGEVFDDYAPLHPMTQAQDAAERLSRMAWIRDTYSAVIGSEGGSAYAAPVIHFAHGMMTPVIGWGDPELTKDKTSKHHLGAYYPPGAPAVFFKQVPMKPAHRRVYADPRFRLPLYQTVFHDSVVATHQWGFGSLKFDDPDGARELLEMLYNVPPLYHLNLAEWNKRRKEIVRRYAFFSPLHREAATLPMTDFAWLTADRLVQRTTFGDGAGRVELIANFGETAFAPGDGGGRTIPGRSVVARWPATGRTLAHAVAAPDAAGRDPDR